MNLTYYSCDYCGNRVNVTASTSSRRVPLVRRQVSSGSRSDCKRKRPPSRNTSQRAFARQMALDRTPRVDGVSLEPLHQNFGVLVEGLDLNQPLTSEQQELLLHAMNQHHLLLFRGAHVDAKAQQRLLQYFPHDRQAVEEQRFNNAFFQPRIPNAPLLALRAHNVKLTEHEGLSEEQLKKADLGGESFRSSRLWHMDLSDDKCAPEVSAMYMVQPAGSGLDDTLFASTEQMFDDLDEETQQKILPLRTVNQKATEFIDGRVVLNKAGTRRLDDMESKLKMTAERGIPTKIQPFVIQDPATGKRSILVSVQRMMHFEGMSHKDSQDLLETILAMGTDDSKIYRHEWQPNDFVIWANRKLIHSASVGESWMAAADKSRLYHLVFLDTKEPVRAAVPG
ncbi:hypothetical protein ABBQ38_003349 [Trebouxia sp. C0009 RCD-2024]